MYTPIKGSWERINPLEVKVDPNITKNLEKFAKEFDCGFPTNLNDVDVSNDPPEWAGKIGPMKERGVPSGLIIKDGYIISEWGDPERVDMIFSITKSFLPLIAGLAYDNGLLKSVDDKLFDVEKKINLKMSDGSDIDGYNSPKNKLITWKHLLQQTSDWEGSLFTKSDLVDWNRSVPEMTVIRSNRMKPGEHWEYNDVRVNRLALSLLCLLKQSLPKILKNKIMDPIGASNTLEWHGYKNHSNVLIDNEKFTSVPGGGHWGGGLWVNTYDLARFGLLMLNRGVWKGKTIISSNWINKILSPSLIKPNYGFLMRINTNNSIFGKYASEKSFLAAGAGGNAVFVDPNKKIIIVTRWCKNPKDLIELLLKPIYGE